MAQHCARLLLARREKIAHGSRHQLDSMVPGIEYTSSKGVRASMIFGQKLIVARVHELNLVFTRLAERSASEVNDLCGRHKVHLQMGFMFHPVAEIRFLAVACEPFVEEAQPLHDLFADHHACAAGVFNFYRLSGVLIGIHAPAREAGARKEIVKKERIDDRLVERRKHPIRHLARHIPVPEPSRAGTSFGMLLQEIHQDFRGVVDEHHVGVQYLDISSIGGSHSPVVRLRDTDIFFVHNDPHLRELPFQHADAVIGRSIVNNDNLERQARDVLIDGMEAIAHVIAAVPVREDDGEIGAWGLSCHGRFPHVVAGRWQCSRKRAQPGGYQTNLFL